MLDHRAGESRAPDGTQTRNETQPDPRWGGGASRSGSSRTETPSGLVRETATTREVQLADPADPFSVQSLVTRTAVNGDTWETVYDGATRTETVTSPEGRTNTTVLDQRRRPVREQTPGLAPVSYEYDDQGQLTRIQEGEGPDARITTLTYDEHGHLQTVTDAEGRTTTRLNDALGRTLKTILPDQREIAFDYDAKGNLTGLTPPGRPEHQMQHNGQDLETGYAPPAVPDATGPLPTRSQWIGTVNGALERQWNNDFDLVRHTVNGQHAINYQYDRDGLLTRAGDLQIQRDPQNGRITGTALNQITTERSYNAFGELQSETARYAGTPLIQWTYQRDRLGRIENKTETLEGQTTVYEYRYDLGGRLSEVRTTGAVTGAWDYDPNGNRTERNGRPPPTTTPRTASSTP